MKKILIFLFLSAMIISSCAKKDSNGTSSTTTGSTTSSNTNTVVACFTMNPSVPTLNNNNVTFDAICSQNAQYYYWFIDGTPLISSTYKDISFSQTFGGGHHTVLLRVVGNSGNDTISKSMDLEPPIIKSYPCFTISPSATGNKYPVNSTLSFDPGCSSNDALSSANYYIDGTTTEVSGDFNGKASYTFTTKGTHRILMYIGSQGTNGGNSGYSDTLSKAVIIY